MYVTKNYSSSSKSQKINNQIINVVVVKYSRHINTNQLAWIAVIFIRNSHLIDLIIMMLAHCVSKDVFDLFGGQISYQSPSVFIILKMDSYSSCLILFSPKNLKLNRICKRSKTILSAGHSIIFANIISHVLKL